MLRNYCASANQPRRYSASALWMQQLKEQEQGPDTCGVHATPIAHTLAQVRFEEALEMNNALSKETQ